MVYLNHTMTALPAPTIDEVDRIATLADPIPRNLQITQCYHQLAATVAERTGPGANWCTFATWASKQAGQTIRKEDLARTLEAAVSSAPLVGPALHDIIRLARRLGTTRSEEHLRRLIWSTSIGPVVDHASDAVSRGNRKVFAEIGREFARFIATCGADPAFDAASIERFCAALRPGDPPDGQQYLRQAFGRYYRSFFATDSQERAELLLLANLEIGRHEQTRLQPEIAESLNAAIADPGELRRRLTEAIFPTGATLTRLRSIWLGLSGNRSLFDRATESFAELARGQVRLALTAHVMTLTLPPNIRIRLGHDLTAEYPAPLRALTNPELGALLGGIDPTPGSARESGAVDWADLPERMHFIADLFRCYHLSDALFAAPFSPEQTAALRAGRVPDGHL
jgi:hypothetical protein